MEHINFRPWVGKNYFSCGFGGKRILVLGESHYCCDLAESKRCFPLCIKANMLDSCYSFTEDVIHDFVFNYSGARYEQTFLCFERACIGKELSQQEREEFWESIIFYNYLQFAQAGPRTSIKPDYWEESELAFKEVLNQFMPDYIIVWGVRLYNGLPNWDGKHSLLQISENDYTDVWTYTINGKQIPALKVYHPSTPIGKSWPYWHDVYCKFFENY